MILFYHKDTGEIFARNDGFENPDINIEGENVGKFIIDKDHENMIIAKHIECPTFDFDIQHCRIENGKLKIKLNRAII